MFEDIVNMTFFGGAGKGGGSANVRFFSAETQLCLVTFHAERESRHGRIVSMFGS